MAELREVLLSKIEAKEEALGREATRDEVAEVLKGFGHPVVVASRYGGHDPIAIGRGMARPGHPDFWAIHDKKLFLFNSEGAKAEFEISPKVAIQMADTAWPMLRETLAP